MSILRPLYRDRFARYQEAVRYFRQLLPAVTGQSMWNLIDMAISYWESPDRWA